MENKEILPQMTGETDKNYERFLKFAQFEGSIGSYISTYCGDVSQKTIRNLSTQFKWEKRKNARKIRNHKVAQKEADKMVKEIVRDKFEVYENCMRLLMKQAEKVLADYDGVVKSVPPAKAAQILYGMPQALSQMKNLQKDISSAEDAQLPVVINYVGGFDNDTSQFEYNENVEGAIVDDTVEATNEPD
jgi:hypothetical protein